MHFECKYSRQDSIGRSEFSILSEAAGFQNSERISKIR